MVPAHSNEALTVAAVGVSRAQPNQRRYHDFRRDQLRAIGRHCSRDQPRVCGAAGHQYIGGDAAAVEFLRQRGENCLVRGPLLAGLTMAAVLALV